MKILYFDCFSGISGDMVLGALLDITRDIPIFTRELDKIGLKDEWEFRAARKNKFGITGTEADVILTHGQRCDEHRHDHEHRAFPEIKELITQSSLKDNIKKTAIDIFSNLALAESDIHGVPVEEVRFHEVGAVDSIIDIVGTAILINQIAPDAVYASSVNTGRGTVHCAHGVLPVPAPATALLLSGMNAYSDGTKGELTTPTGAAVLKTLCGKSTPLPSMRISNIGYGFGKKDTGGINALRVFLSETEQQSESILLLEANIDDMTGEALGAALQVLLRSGALDAYFIPVYMKKQRPAYILCTLCHPQDKLKFEQLIYKHTSTIGIRSAAYERSPLARSGKVVQTSLGDIHVKEAEGFGIIRIKPEYEDILRIAQNKDMAFDEVYKIVLKELDR